MSGKTTLKSREIRVLKALRDKKEYGFNNLRDKTGLSPTSLSKALKSLQLPEETRKIKRNPNTRKYEITSKGEKALQIEDAANIFTKSKTMRLETVKLVPVDSIVAIDAPELSSAQQKILMNGTPDVAKAVFNQFFTDMQLKKGGIPESGRLAYMISIDFRKAKDWLDSAEGKNYTVTSKGED